MSGANDEDIDDRWLHNICVSCSVYSTCLVLDNFTVSGLRIFGTPSLLTNVIHAIEGSVYFLWLWMFGFSFEC